MRSISLLAPLLVLVPSVAHAQAAQTAEKAGTSAPVATTPQPATPPTATPEPEMAAPAATSTVAIDAPPVDVHFSTAEPGVTVYARPVTPERLTGTDAAHEGPAFQAICQAPCDAKLEPTLHEFAVAPAGSEPIPAAPAFELRSDARFRADVISHESRRRAGWWIFGIMGTVGITTTTIGMFQTCVDDQTCQEWTSLAIWSGVAITTAGTLIGLPMIMTSDEATITLVPGTAPLANPARVRLPDRAASVRGSRRRDLRRSFLTGRSTRTTRRRVSATSRTQSSRTAKRSVVNEYPRTVPNSSYSPRRFTSVAATPRLKW